MKYDYVICGSGITGATIARLLFDAGREVVVLEKRDGVGGNVADDIHRGFRYGLYGPHYFRTNDDRIWEYAQRFSEFVPFEAVVKTMVNGVAHDWPITQEMIGDFAPLTLESGGNFEEEHLRRFPRDIYERFIKDYTEKQWGVPATSIDAPRSRMVEIRQSGDKRLSTKKYQGVPKNGYTSWVSEMLRGIEILTGFDYLEHREDVFAGKMLVFTGPIDAFFGYTHGKLPSRSQRRRHFVCSYRDVLPTCQLNYPAPTLEFIRLIEWKKIWPVDSPVSLLTSETPVWGGDEYPFPSQDARRLYSKYRSMADGLDGVVICGRMGEFRYYDMDQAIARASKIGQDIIRDH